MDQQQQQVVATVTMDVSEVVVVLEAVRRYRRQLVQQGGPRTMGGKVALVTLDRAARGISGALPAEVLGEYMPHDHEVDDRQMTLGNDIPPLPDDDDEAEAV